MQASSIISHPNTTAATKLPGCSRARLGFAAGAVLIALSLAGCSGGGIYANVGISGPSVDLGPVKIHTGVNLGRWL